MLQSEEDIDLRAMSAPLALLSSASMLLIPHIGWESHRDLTHSVLVTTMAAATAIFMSSRPSQGSITPARPAPSPAWSRR